MCWRSSPPIGRPTSPARPRIFAAAKHRAPAPGGGGALPPYGTGPGPNDSGRGYPPAKDYWRLGTIFGAIFLAALLLIGYPW
ncbi:anion permease, partial [Klebsiella pneumoniae]|nr:anion permease [Klebsiella pneumoniae]